jgi:hypothetical protein
MAVAAKHRCAKQNTAIKSDRIKKTKRIIATCLSGRTGAADVRKRCSGLTPRIWKTYRQDGGFIINMTRKGRVPPENNAALDFRADVNVSLLSAFV